MGNFTAKLLHLDMAQERISEDAKPAVQCARDIRPYVIGPPALMGFEFTSTTKTEGGRWIPAVDRTSPRTTEDEFDDWFEGMGLLFALVRLALHLAEPMY